MANDNKLVNLADLKAAFDEVNDKAGVTSVNGQTGAVSVTPENIKAFKQIPGYITREMLDDYSIKYWYGGKINASVALAIGLPPYYDENGNLIGYEWFVLNMSKDDDADSSWTRQVFYQLDGSMIFERTCSYHTWNPVTKVSIIDDYGHAATIKQEVINSARSFILHSCGNVYPDVGAIFKETGLQLWDYNNGSELWWLPKVIGVPQGGTDATNPAEARANLEITPENIGAVNKAGDTMTGDLTLPHLDVRSGGRYTNIYLRDSSNAPRGMIWLDGETGRIFFRSVNPSVTSEDVDRYYTDYYLYPSSLTNISTSYKIYTERDTIPVDHGGTGATGVETSQLVINPELSSYGISAAIRDDNTSQAVVRKWGKLYTVQYAIRLTGGTFTGETRWVRLVNDSKGWLNSQINNMPLFLRGHPSWELLYGINGYFVKNTNYTQYDLDISFSWIDPN